MLGNKEKEAAWDLCCNFLVWMLNFNRRLMSIYKYQIPITFELKGLSLFDIGFTQGYKEAAVIS